MQIRAVELADATAIAAIYNREVAGSTVTFDMVPRTLDQQRDWIRDHRSAHPAFVADIDGTVAGFASLSPYRPRPAYTTTVETSVYVHEDHRRSGVAKALMTELVETSDRLGYHCILAHIVGGHDASIALHASFGFSVVGTQHEVGRKFGRWLDVVIMERLSQPAPR